MPANLSTTAAMQTVSELLASSSASLPPPPLSTRPYNLDPNNLSVLPRSAFLGGDESRAAFGLMQVPKLECCFGRCRCPPGECTCMSDCCGCVRSQDLLSYELYVSAYSTFRSCGVKCDKCLCDDDDDDAAPSGTRTPEPAATVNAAPSEPTPATSSGGCCSTKAEVIESDIPTGSSTFAARTSAPAKRSCCAPSLAPASAKQSCCAPQDTGSSNSAGGKKKACGSDGCGGRSAQPPPRLRPLLPKPPAAERLLSAQAPSTGPLPSGGPNTSGFVAGSGQSRDDNGSFRLAQDPSIGVTASGQSLSPDFLAALLGQSPGGTLPTPVFGQFDIYASTYGTDPTMPAISDAELDEMMATLAAANGGSLAGLDWDAALGAQSQSFEFDAAGLPQGEISYVLSPSSYPAYSFPDPQSMIPAQGLAADPPFDLRTHVDSFATSSRPSQPGSVEPSSSLADASEVSHGYPFASKDIPSFTDLNMPDSVILPSAGLDWSTLLAESPSS